MLPRPRRTASSACATLCLQIHQKVPAVAVAAEVWSNAFRAHFIPFWNHCASHKLRACRLNNTQYHALHGMNAATRLTQLLTESERMQLQRVALRTPSASILTLEEVAALLSIDGVRGSSCNGGSKGPVDAVRTMGEAGGKNAARILSFCRSASVTGALLVYDLGERTRRLQAGALVRRLLVNEAHELPVGYDPLDHVHLVPEHSRCICACVECKRVSNAACTDGGMMWKHPFNELGTSTSMLSNDAATGESCIRCAKRASASLRAAMAVESEMDSGNVEFLEQDTQTTHNMLVSNSVSTDSRVAARVRRDSKSAFEQRVASVACGTERMLTVPILGKAVRLWGEWYALCAYCACFVRFHPTNRAGTEICCLRCDDRMLYRKELHPLTAKEAATSVPKCRFCGKVRGRANAHDRHARHRTPPLAGGCTAQWREVEARALSSRHERPKRKPAATAAHGSLLPDTLSLVDTGVPENHAHACGALTHRLRCAAVLRGVSGRTGLRANDEAGQKAAREAVVLRRFVPPCTVCERGVRSPCLRVNSHSRPHAHHTHRTRTRACAPLAHAAKRGLRVEGPL